MISTITTSTISTVTSAALTGSVALISILFLLSFLIQKEVISVSEDSRLKNLSRALNIAIVPLLIAFIVIVIVQVSAVLK